MFLQDALFKEFGSAGMQKEIEAAVPMLLESQEVLSKQPSMSFSPLECFAKVRFALSVVAETLKGQMELKNPNDIVEEFSSATYLFEAAKNICTSSDLNHIDASDSFGPNIYLLKLLIRRYGFTTLPKFVELHDWLIPKEFQAELTVSLLMCCRQVLALFPPSERETTLRGVRPTVCAFTTLFD